jgi:integrase
VPPIVFEAVTGLVAREDRTPDRRVFQGFGGDRFRTAIARACTASGVPTFSPHDLQHRRISLLHLSGTPWARIGEHVGQRNLAVTANTTPTSSPMKPSLTTRKCSARDGWCVPPSVPGRRKGPNSRQVRCLPGALAGTR